jgi:hypothetical protein
MKITVFTSNQRRHLSLINDLASVADTVFAVQEVTTLFPGKIEDFYRKSPIMQRYFERVTAAEERLFLHPKFLPDNVRTLALRMGDLNSISPDWIAESLDADLFVVFGASFIKRPLVDVLVEKKAINIHVGVSPFYRGSSCNFWAVNDNNAEYVGATIHLLTAGLDSGPMLFHTFPSYDGENPFEFTMKAVKSAHIGLVSRIADASLKELLPEPQDRSCQLRYSKKDDFTDGIAERFLARGDSLDSLSMQVSRRDLSLFKDPFVLQ